MKLKLIEAGVRQILEGLEVDLEDRNYKETPRRVARMYQELFTPKKNTWSVFPEHHNSLILLRGHEVFGVCPHHLVPVRMVVYLGYIPHKNVLGLSKLARCIEEQLDRPVMQETFTDNVAMNLMMRLDAKGVACVVVGNHGCMQARGVKTHGDVVTSSMNGVFFTNPPAREEFLRLIGRI